MRVTINSYERSQNKMGLTITDHAAFLPDSFAISYGDVVLARSATPITYEQVSQPDDAWSFFCDLPAWVDTEMVLPAFAAARYEAHYPGGEAMTATLTPESMALLEKVSPTRSIWSKDDLILGQNDFVFFRNGHNHLISQHQGLLRLSEQAAKIWQSNLEFRADASREFKIPFLTVVIPNKETVYRDFIPDFPISDQRPVCQLTELAREIGLESSFVTLEDGLLRLAREYLARPEQDILYDSTTSYWNGVGACLAFNMLAPRLSAMLGVEIPQYDLADLEQKRCRILTGWGGAYDPFIIENRLLSFPRHFSSTLAFDNKVSNRAHCRVYHNSTQLKRALIFCDSYTFNVWWQFFAERFESVILAHQTAMDRRLVEFVKPDIVINAMTERFLIWPPNDATEPAFLSLAEFLGKEGGANLDDSLQRVLGLTPADRAPSGG